jgi:hypothetical protein
VRPTKKADETEVATLAQAHAEATRTRPAPGSPLVMWREFHRRNIERYREVSDLDRFHHHEALYWVSYEERRHEDVKRKLAASPSTVESDGTRR